MKKKISLLLILLLIITPFLGLVEIPIVEASPAPVVIDTSSASGATYSPVQRKLVRASDGTLYAAYDKKEAGIWHVYTKYSTDYGASWTGETRISIPAADIGDGYFWPSIAIDSDDYLHVVWIGYPPGGDKLRIWYSKYTTSWSTPIILSTRADMDPQDREKPVILVDSTDNLHVIWDGYITDVRHGICYSNYTDTWSTPLIISNITDVAAGGDYATMAIDSNDYLHVVWAQLGSYWYINHTATGWSLGYNISVNADMIGIALGPSITIDYDDNPHVVWFASPTGWGENSAIWYAHRAGAWVTPIIISNATGMENYPQQEATITTDLNNYHHVFWDGKATGLADKDKIWYANYTTSWTVPICLQPTGQNQFPNVRWSRYPSFNRVGFLIDYVFTEGTGAYSIMFDRELLPPIVQFGIVNPELCDNDRWVFEGWTNYIFSLNVSHEGHGDLFSSGVHFYDAAGDMYSFYYSNATGLMTYMNPDDGVSISLRSVSTGTEWLNITANVMFNPPVADTSDVDVYVRHVTPVWSDSGWVVEEADYFNIYNLGGFSTLDWTGYSGRTAGGDVFEIYAADERVAKMFYESFEKEYVWTYYELLGPRYEAIYGLKWLTLDDPPYSNVTATRLYPNTNSRAYAYSGAWRDGKSGLQIQTIDATNIIPWTAKQFLRPITDETVRTTLWWQSPANASTARLKWADIPTYLSAAKTAVNLRIHSLDVPAVGKVECDIAGSAYDVYDAAGINPVRWYTDTWYNVTVHVDMTTKRWTLWWQGAATNATGELFADAVGPTKLEWFLALGSNGLGGLEISDFFIDAVNCTTDFSGDYGGDVKATALFNRLQHWHMDFDLDVEDGYVAPPYANYGFIELGWDVCINGTWENNFLVAQVNITSADIPSQSVAWLAAIEETIKAFTGGKANYVRFNVTWTQNGTFLRRHTLYGLYEGYGELTTTEGAKNAMGFHWDIWFNSINASTVGGRINCEWFGMSNKVSGIASIWTSAWKPMVDEVTDSTCFTNLLDSTDVLHSVKEVSLVRSWVRVWRSNEDTFHYEIKGIEGMDFRRTTGTMSGIDTPPIVKTMAPQVASGFMGSLLGTAFMAVMADFGDSIIFGAMSMWSYFIDMLDVILGYLGYPSFVSTALGIAANFFGYMATIITEGYLYDIIVQLFIIPTYTFGHIIHWLTLFLSTWVDIFDIVWAIIDGTYTITTGLGNLWDFVSFNEWSEAVPIFLVISLLLHWDNKAKRGPDGYVTVVLKDIKLGLDFAGFFVTMFIRMIDFFIATIARMVEMIPGIG